MYVKEEGGLERVQSERTGERGTRPERGRAAGFESRRFDIISGESCFQLNSYQPICEVSIFFTSVLKSVRHT